MSKNQQETRNKINTLHADDLSNIRWHPFIDTPSGSYMTGATGVAYAWMRIIDSGLPSIMVLDFAH